MRQILQSLKDGQTSLARVPAPAVGRGKVLISTARSLISAGTERMLVDFGRANFLDKARQQPEKVREVLDKVRTDGVMTTVDAVRSKLDQPLPLGYCNVGRVAALGAGVEGFAHNDRVVSNGAHAEIVSVPQNLCAKIPDAVDDDSATFTVLGAVALQGIRLAAPTLGESVVVTGLGLLGLLMVQILKANGCRVLGIDFDEGRLALARRFGAETVNPAAGEDVLQTAERFSRGRGVDAVLLTLSAKSSEPVSQAAKMCRKRGRVVLVGVTGLELNRSDFYEKELSFQVSCSYGPGRYDPAYEENGQDYPVGFVRWTEQRNFEAVLDLMASGQLDVAALISHRFTLADAPKAYDLLAGGEPSLGIMLEYAPGEVTRDRTVALTTVSTPTESQEPAGKTPAVSFIGAGNYAGRVLIPAFKSAGAELVSVASGGGVSAAHYGRKFGFKEATTDTDSVMADTQSNTVVIATRHDSHAALVEKALKAGKHVFVEKPLALTLEELTAIEGAHKDAGDLPPLVMVGFNRRFSLLSQNLKKLLDAIGGPTSLVITVNAGAIPADHWTQDPEIGGGRIIGEACHFIDLMRFFTGQPITSRHVQTAGRRTDGSVSDDVAVITVGFADGSVGTIQYLANGHKSFPKERVEVFAGGRIAQIDNFRKLNVWGWPKAKTQRLLRQDKGQVRCSAAFLAAIREGAPSPIPFDEIIEVSRVTIELGMAARAVPFDRRALNSMKI